MTRFLAGLYACYASFDSDPVANINRLTKLCGELLGADCALYNRLDRGMLVSLGMWNAPPDFNPKDKPDGHICYDVIRNGGKEVSIVRDIPHSIYAKTDPNVGRYNLKTYVGIPVKRKKEHVGSLCLLYQKDFLPSPEDRTCISIIATIISREEDRAEQEANLRKSEETLRETNTYLENLITCANAPIIVWDPQLHITRFNRAFESLTGRKAGEVIGKPLKMLFPAGRAGNFRDLIRETLEGKRWEDVEIRILHIDGTLRTVLWNSATICGPDGKTPLATIAQGQDITERKRSEQELLERNDELTRFAYAVSHDLKSPLVTVQTFLGYLEADLGRQDAAGVAKDLGYIRKAADKMSRLLDELLDLSRVGHKMNPPAEALLQEVAGEALSLVAGRIAARGVEVVVTQERAVLFGDRPRLVEVFQNLVDNAVKFMGEQPRPRMEIGFETRGSQTVFFVRDNGIGIDPRHKDKLFGLFEKLDPGTEGTGIGLTLARRIVEVHGGKMWVESDGPGLGATFLFTLANAKRAPSQEAAS